MPLKEGQRLGNYRLDRLLGKGSFAEVYLAEHLYLNTSAAIKVLHTTLSEEEEHLFLTEAQIIAKLVHPNIVRVREFAIERSLPYLVMDYAPGGTLRQRYPRGTCLSLEQTVSHIKQIAAALQHAHNQGIIHRDVKPENVLQGAGQVLLSDFGISVSSPLPGATTSQSWAGTLAYVAPEQLQGQAAFASDQYALAILAYEWLCGVRPFEGSGMALVHQHVHLPPPPLREKDPSLPQAVEAVILKALSKYPNQRYASILAFARALERASRGDSNSTSEALAETELADEMFPIPGKRIFLSHAHLDDITRLRTDLVLRHFMLQDEVSPDNQEEQTRQSLRASQTVLLVLTPHTLSSSAVQEQLRIARLYRRRIICFWAEGKALQDVLPTGLGQTTILDARDQHYKAALEELVLAIEDEQRVIPYQPFAKPDFEPRNPYKGLNAFTQEDRADFFGRQTLVQELLARLREQMTDATFPESSDPRFLAVIGPSGSGKSSVVRAGLLPALQDGALSGSEQWLYLDPLVPGMQPLSALAHLLAQAFPERGPQAVREILGREGSFGLHQLGLDLMRHPKMKVVVTLDQFEEIFASDIPEPERLHFIQLLVTAVSEPRGPILVLLTLRADFYDRPFAYPALGHLIQQRQCAVLPMSLEDLREVIERPALLPDVRLTFDEDLVSDLLFDLRGEAGALPLLEFTLEQLFYHRRDHRLTRYAYVEIGGVRGAISQHAETTYAELPSEEHRQLARTLFLRLVQPNGKGQDPLRRRTEASEFQIEQSERMEMMRQTIDAFTAARLIISTRTMGIFWYEISHEALLREWPRLARWVREAREDMHLQQTISHDVREWERRGKPKDRLYRGSQLKESLAWQERNIASGTESTFLRASITRRMHARISLSLAILLLLAVLVPAGMLFVQQATPLTVTTLKDDVQGSLRQAITNTRSGGTILIDPHLKGTIFLNRDIVINKNITIRGQAADQLTIRGARDFSGLIQVQTHTTVIFSQLTFSDPTPSPGSVITNYGTLTLVGCHIIGNNEQGVSIPSGNLAQGGAITNLGGTLILQESLVAHNTISAGESFGGGIANGPGTLILNNSQIIDNTAISNGQLANGGGIYNALGQVTVTASIIAGNKVMGATVMNGGGGIYSQQGSLSISHSTISNNNVQTNGGRAYSDGGGIMSLGSKVSIDMSRLQDNTVISNAIFGNTLAGGGGLYAQNAISSNKVIATSNITITKSVFSSNTVTATNSPTRGGGIANVSGSLSLNESIVERNQLTSRLGVAGGGGIYSGEALNITDSIVSDNLATAPSDQYGSIGGGIDTKGTLILLRSSVVHNTVSSKGIAAGGGIYADQPARTDAHIILTNNTLAYNKAQGAQGIGGGFSTDRTPMRTSIDFCTIVGNSASTRAGGIDGDQATTPTNDLLLLKNSIMAANTAPVAPDISETFLSGGHNLVQHWDGAQVNDALHLHRTDLTANAPGELGLAVQLGMNGGPTPTLALQAVSLAVHAIPLSACDVDTDQRSVKRRQHSTCDIGSYEYS